jgi:predicted transglutaminase-like cysteine proteinase
MRGLLATLLAFGCIAPSLHAGGASKAKTVFDQWEAAFLGGGRAGHVHTYTEEFDLEGEKLLRTTQELRLTVKRFKDVIQLAMDVGMTETPDGKVTGVFMRQYLGKTKQLDLSGTVVGKQLQLKLDGKTPIAPAPWNDKVLSLQKQQTMFKDRAVEPGAKFSYLNFEPQVNLVLETHVVVKDFEEVELPGLKKKRKLLRVEVRSDKIQGVELPMMVVWLNENKEKVAASIEGAPGLGNIQLLVTTKASALSTGPVAELTDIGFDQLVRLKKAIANPYDTTQARYRVTIKDEAEPDKAFASDDRQQIKTVSKNVVEIAVSAKRGPYEGNAKEPGAEYTQNSYFIACDDAKVKEHARAAVGAEKDAWKKALRIEKWVNLRMKSANHEALATADHVARTLTGDCTEYAMLTAAMCRAEGVPSRTAVGLIYADVRGTPNFAFHMWTEVWVQGSWIPLDATLGKGYVGATHLKVSHQSWQDERSQTPLLTVVRVLGKLNIEVLEAGTGR